MPDRAPRSGSLYFFNGSRYNNHMKERKYNWLKSAVINAVILAVVLLCTHMVYETNDDYALASRIVDGYAEVNFVNYYLCRVLVWAQKIAPALNIYIVSQVVSAYISFTCILKMILDQSTSKIIGIVSTAVIALFSIDHYCTVQFTKTSVLLICAGLLMMVDSITNKRGLLYYVLSIMLLYLGVAFRIDGLIAIAGFAGLYGLMWLIDNRSRLIKDGYFSVKRIAIYIILLAFVGGCYTFDGLSASANRSTEELEAYKEYSVLRSAVVDYPVYDYYENNQEAYEEIGISENDLYLIDHWYFDYDGAASVENLNNIIEVDSADERPAYTMRQAARRFKRETLASIKKFGFTGIHIILLGFIAVWMLFALKPKYWIYIIAVGLMALTMYLLLYYRQRPQYRALYVADIGAAIWLLYGMSSFFKADSENKRSGRNKPLVIMGACVVIAAMMLSVPLKSDCSSMYAKSSRKVISSEMAEYIKANEDSFYVFGTSEKKSSDSYLKPWLAPDTESDRNTIGTGSWGTMSPYVLDKLAAYDMTNPIKDLIDNDKAYYVGKKNIRRLTEYYNKWYGSKEKTIRFEKVDTKGGLDIWKIWAE